MTPNSSVASYCPASEFFKRCDLRTVADWASDSGSRANTTPPSTNPDPVALGQNVNVVAALASASGMFESALLKGKRYQPSDVQTLIGIDSSGNAIAGFVPTNGTAYVYEVVTRLAEGMLWRRRPDLSPYPPMFDWAMDQLDQLGAGGAILPFAETQQAGIPGHHVETTVDVETRNLVLTQAKRYFGRRGCELNG